MDETQIREQMQKVVDNVRQDISGIRTGRITPSLVEDIMVEAYGGSSRLRIMELASITVQDPQTLLITPWDKQVVGEIRKGIEIANIGLNPAITGDALRIVLPPLTAEDREKYVKLLHQKLENGRVAIRQSRQDGMKDIKKGFEDKTITEDERSAQEKKLQELTDQFISQIDEVGKNKETELRTV
jgi:ribosome recycling factor